MISSFHEKSLHNRMVNDVSLCVCCSLSYSLELMGDAPPRVEWWKRVTVDITRRLDDSNVSMLSTLLHLDENNVATMNLFGVNSRN